MMFRRYVQSISSSKGALVHIQDSADDADGATAAENRASAVGSTKRRGSPS
jgi:hypothetical protein